MKNLTDFLKMVETGVDPCLTLRVLSISPNQSVRNHWNYQEKMEQYIFQLKQSFK